MLPVPAAHLSSHNTGEVCFLTPSISHHHILIRLAMGCINGQSEKTARGSAGNLPRSAMKAGSPASTSTNRYSKNPAEQDPAEGSVFETLDCG